MTGPGGEQIIICRRRTWPFAPIASKTLEDGAGYRIRTRDPLITNRTIYLPHELQSHLVKHSVI